jgi:hypothetical protein
MGNKIKTNADWQKESDARTLAEAERIKSEPSRLKGAQAAAKRMLSEQQKEAQALSKIASSSNQGPKSPIKLSTPVKK